LRKIADKNGKYLPVVERSIAADDMEAVLKQAAWDSITENRPDITGRYSRLH